MREYEATTVQKVQEVTAPGQKEVPCETLHETIKFCFYTKQN